MEDRDDSGERSEGLTQAGGDGNAKERLEIPGLEQA